MFAGYRREAPSAPPDARHVEVGVRRAGCDEVPLPGLWRHHRIPACFRPPDVRDEVPRDGGAGRPSSAFPPSAPLLAVAPHRLAAGARSVSPLDGEPFRGPERFTSKIEVVGECWIWTACTHQGYGVYMPDCRRSGDRKVVRAHRFAYELWVGPIPEGLELHHRLEDGCTSRACVNPAHLLATTRADHPDSGPAVERSRKLCDHGHSLDGHRSRKDNPNGSRFCITCKRESDRAHYRIRNAS